MTKETSDFIGSILAMTHRVKIRLLFSLAVAASIATFAQLGDSTWFSSSGFRQSDETDAQTWNDLPVTSPDESTLLVIATVPRSWRHFLALWSQLECLTDGIDQVLLSGPVSSSVFLGKIVEKARSRLALNIEVRCYVNDRYDAGLWCDALNEVDNLRNQTRKYTILSNDSFVIFQHFRGILDQLRRKQHDFVSLSAWNVTNFFFLESVLRGFTSEGLRVFTNHSCVPLNHTRNCHHLNHRPVLKKRCIVEAQEIELVKAYQAEKVVGLFPSTASIDSKRHWVSDERWWKELVQMMDFPVVKVKMQRAIDSLLKEDNLTTCTRHLPLELILDFFLNVTNKVS